MRLFCFGCLFFLVWFIGFCGFEGLFGLKVGILCVLWNAIGGDTM
jgi:hypothetical protein